MAGHGDRGGPCGPGRPACAGGTPPRPGRRAQTTVELLLVLPVFCLMLFMCMELGNIAHQIIVVNHAAYEMARIGSLVAGPRGGDAYSSANPAKAEQKMRAVMQEMFPNYHGKMTLSVEAEDNQEDPQVPGHMNEDLVVRVGYPVQLLFPLSNYILADGPNKENHTMMIHVSMRMPVEKPVFR